MDRRGFRWVDREWKLDCGVSEKELIGFLLPGWPKYGHRGIIKPSYSRCCFTKPPTHTFFRERLTVWTLALAAGITRCLRVLRQNQLKSVAVFLKPSVGESSDQRVMWGNPTWRNSPIRGVVQVNEDKFWFEGPSHIIYGTGFIFLRRAVIMNLASIWIPLEINT